MINKTSMVISSLTFLILVAVISVLSTTQQARAELPNVQLPKMEIIVDRTVIGEWQITDVKAVDEGNINLSSDSELTLKISISKESKVSINLGCNGVFGDAVIINGRVTFGDKWTSTMKLCGESRNVIEHNLRKALSKISYYHRVLNQLHFFDKDGNHIIASRYVGVDY